MKTADKQQWNLQADTEQGAIALSGEVDFSSSNTLRAALDDFIKASSGEVKLDLSGLTYLDSSGLAVLIGLRKKLDAKGRELVVTAIHINAEKVFRLTQVAGLFGL